MSTRLPSLFERYPTLQACERDLHAAFDLLALAFRNGHKLLICGNGGSAADSEHIVGELLKGFLRRRPISTADAAKLEAVGGKEIVSRLQGALPAISLPSQMSLLTAVGNDTDYDLTFAHRFTDSAGQGMFCLAISTSGNSANVCNAAIVAKAFNIKSIALTGRSGGQLAPLSDVAIRVPSDNVAEIQELHLPVYHWLSTELEAAFFPA